MPRVARIVVPGLPHHITQRGNNRQPVFFSEDDHREYLRLLGQQAERFGLAILGYCLMSNHIHLIAVPRREDSLARAVGRAHFLYTQHVNRRRERVGHLWQNRFYSCPLEDAGVGASLCYVERNPVRAALVRQAWQYPWSSAAAHCGAGRAAPLLDMAAWRRTGWGPRWKDILRVEDDASVAALRRQTATGRPLGGDKFLAKLEARLGRPLRPRPIGRPKGWRKSKSK